MRESLANGEPEGYACRDCLVRDLSRCPELDALSAEALRFGCRFNHPAHEGYREHLLPHLWPDLLPGQFHGFLARLEVAWEVGAEEARRRREAEAEEARRRAGTGKHPGGNDGG